MFVYFIHIFFICVETAETIWPNFFVIVTLKRNKKVNMCINFACFLTNTRKPKVNLM